MLTRTGPSRRDGASGSAPPDQPGAAFRDALFAAGLLLATGVDGVYGRSALYEGVAEAVDALVLRVGADQQAARVRFPPVMPWTTFRDNGYLESFPDQMGAVLTFAGGERDHAQLVEAAEAGADPTPFLRPAGTVLCPAVCHPLYPTLRGVLPEGGRRFEVYGYCFRHEPSVDPFRMQAFRQHDYVYVGSPEAARRFQEGWIDRAAETLGGLGLDVSAVPANDPFFGRPGRMLAANQRDERLKYEVVVPVGPEGRDVAISSSNCHLDHFGGPFGIQTEDGGTAHSACVGFGVDRVTLALFDRHGLEPDRWPSPVRDALWP
ncbi:MAG: amino acid--[acyl-carrier-protein] ligase [Acidimicrobiales bacterium]|nr:amino acid--[acyl-carrier-protein] ligase [Acidimicrobiales bacterium]